MKAEDVNVKVEFSDDTSQRFTEACLKILRRREKNKNGRLNPDRNTN